MNKTFNTFFKFDESTEICKLSYFSLDYIIYMISFLKVDPWIFCKVLERKVDSLFCRVKADNLKFNFLTFLYKILWTCNVTPAHIIDMEKTVKSAKIDECTETCKALYSSLYSVTNLDVVEEFFTLCINLFFKISSAVNNNICFII